MKTAKLTFWIMTAGLLVGVGLWLFLRHNSNETNAIRTLPVNRDNKSGWGNSSELSSTVSSTDRIAATRNPGARLTFAERFQAMSMEEKRHVTRAQYQEWMTEMEREALTIGDVKMFDPARRTGTESRVTQKDQKILRWFQIGPATDEDAQEVGMICVRYRLTRNEVLSLMGYTTVADELGMGYPYGPPAKLLSFEFDKSGALRKAYLPNGAVEVPPTTPK